MKKCPKVSYYAHRNIFLYIWAWSSPPQLGGVLVSLKFKLFDFFGGIIGMFEKQNWTEETHYRNVIWHRPTIRILYIFVFQTNSMMPTKAKSLN